MVKKVIILGSTGSIGVQALDVCSKLGIKVLAISANENFELLKEQARLFKPKLVCIANEKYYKTLKEDLCDVNCKVVAKEEGFLKAVSLDCDLVINSIVGVAGLLPTIFALNNKKNVAIANKESLVTGGEIITKLAEKNDCKILPIDSEHSAIFQCMQNNGENKIKKIILTASGGPFFGKTREFLKDVSVKDALNHPNWKMGKKITIDSATMMNKGFELIEAMHLFKKKEQEIEIVINPQSVLHSAVEYEDGAIIGQFSSSDMRLAIQYALTYPKRCASLVEPFSFSKIKNISFFEPDYEVFLTLNLCKEAAKKGGLWPTVLNAANEKAVEYFLNGKIKFLDIEKIIKKAMRIKDIDEKVTIDSILKTDSYVKEFVKGIV